MAKSTTVAAISPTSCGQVNRMLWPDVREVGMIRSACSKVIIATDLLDVLKEMATRIPVSEGPWNPLSWRGVTDFLKGQKCCLTNNFVQ